MDDQNYFNYDDVENQLKEIREDIKARQLPNKEVPLEAQLRQTAEALAERIKKDETYLKSKEAQSDFFLNEKKEELLAKKYQLGLLQKEYRDTKGSENRKAIEAVWRQRANEIVEKAQEKKWQKESADRESDYQMKEKIRAEMEAGERRRKLQEGVIEPNNVI